MRFHVCVLQDDSSLNVKVVVRLIEGEKAGPFANATLLTADDGATAVEQLRTEMAAGRAVHFVLMDFVMVGNSILSVFLFSFPFLRFLSYIIEGYHARARGSPHHEGRAPLPRTHHRYSKQESIYSCSFQYMELYDIGITGNALPEDIDFFVSSGANQVVTKPLSRAKLLDALHHFLPTAMAAKMKGGEED